MGCMETGIGDIGTAMLTALPPKRAAALRETITIDVGTTDFLPHPARRPGWQLPGVHRIREDLLRDCALRGMRGPTRDAGPGARDRGRRTRA